MTTHPHYTDHVISTPRRMSKPSDPARLENRLRMSNTDYPQDLMWEAADCIRDLARLLGEANAREAAREAALVTMRADRDRLATKVQAVAELLEPRTWADNSRQRTLLAAVVFDGVPQPRKDHAA